MPTIVEVEEVRQGQTYREFVDNYREPHADSKAMFEKFKKETMEAKAKGKLVQPVTKVENKFKALEDDIDDEPDYAEHTVALNHCDPTPTSDGWTTTKKKMPKLEKNKVTRKVDWHTFAEECQQHDAVVQVDNDKRRGQTLSLTEKDNPSLNSMAQEVWQSFIATVDSGASEHVVPPTCVSHVPLQDGPKKGVPYECADGGEIHNLGERRCVVGNDYNWTENRIDLQVTEVHKPLLSVAKMVDAGQKVVFDAKGSYIEDTLTGEHIPIERRGGIYELKLWAKEFKPTEPTTGFAGQR